MDITSLNNPLPAWSNSYAQDFELENGEVLHGVYLRLPDGLSHWILDADSAEEAKKVSALINMAASTYLKD
jgi:hypothetical protein